MSRDVPSPKTSLALCSSARCMSSSQARMASISKSPRRSPGRETQPASHHTIFEAWYQNWNAWHLGEAREGSRYGEGICFKGIIQVKGSIKKYKVLIIQLEKLQARCPMISSRRIAMIRLRLLGKYQSGGFRSDVQQVAYNKYKGRMKQVPQLLY